MPVIPRPPPRGEIKLQTFTLHPGLPLAYVVVEITIHDPETYKRYMALAPASIAKYGGRYAVRGGTTEALEGTWNPQRFVILEFPTADAARKWWSGPEYSAARAIRQSCADARMLLVDGPSFDPAKP